MKSFENSFGESLHIPQILISIIRQIGEYKGKQDLFAKQAPEMLENLRRIAVIQSTESSNRLEVITAEPKRLHQLMAEKTDPKKRSESTILAAYKEFENRLGSISSGRGSKTDMVLSAIDGIIGDFSLSDLERTCPSVGRDWIRKLLQNLKSDGKVESLGKGRYARWRKIQ